MLKNCWRKVYIFCKCHPTCFFRHAGSFILSFNVKSEMATDMLLSVILSELVDSDDENTRRGKTLKWIRFLRPFFFFCFLCTLSLICLPFFAIFDFFYCIFLFFPILFLQFRQVARIFVAAVQTHFDLKCMIFFIAIILQSVLVLLNHSKFEVLTFEITL